MTDTHTDEGLREQIESCFKRTKMQQDGDTELFDTELTIDNILALIRAETVAAYGRGSIDTLEHVKSWADKTETSYNEMISERIAELHKLLEGDKE